MARRTTDMSVAELNAIIAEGAEAWPDGFTIHDADFKVLFANERSERDFAATFNALDKGQDFREATRTAVGSLLPDMSEADRLAMADQISDTLEEGKPIELLTPEGRIMQVMFRPLSKGGGT